ncbi:hypothetical protein VPNG_05214 [Cytospora leucostoma]|uniref:Uncharacterized protein n=1 Tax=Cytospora leucostoma TaxID=1230097 RepID=A0A423X7L0_9PEZI|nr:hypothetical protein VPNG_05214 [Cytospora leucostoma]
MAVLKNLLVNLVAITCIAVIQSVAGAPAVKPFVSFTETMTSTVNLPNTTFTTTHVVTEAAGWHEQPPNLALEVHTVPPHNPGHGPSVDTGVVVERADSSAATWITGTVPMVTVTATVDDGGDLPVATDAEHRNNDQDMTLSLTTSTTSHSSMLFTSIFPDPGIFGHPPPIQTATTRLTAWTTPDFPVVPSVLPDGTKLRRYHAASNTPGLSGAVALPGKIIEGTPTDDPPIYPSTTYTTDSRSHRPTSSDDCPGVGEFGNLLPAASGGRSHFHSSYTSWPRTCLPTNKRSVTLEGRPEIPLTETRQPSPLPSWHGEGGGERPKQPRSIIERQSGGYDFGTSVPDFSTPTPPPTTTTWEGTSTAHRVAATKIIMHTAVMCPIHLPGQPQPLGVGGASLPLETSLLDDTVDRDGATRAPMAAPTDSTITSTIDFVRASTVLHSSNNITSEFVTIPTIQPSPVETTPSETPSSSETVHLVTMTTTITCSTCGPCLMTGIAPGPVTVAHPPPHGGKPISIWNGTMLPFASNTLTTETTTLETSVRGILV